MQASGSPGQELIISDNRLSLLVFLNGTELDTVRRYCHRSAAARVVVVSNSESPRGQRGSRGGVADTA
jgi:hypothetical protein